MIVVNDSAPIRIRGTRRGRITGSRLAIAAALCLFPGLILVGSGDTPLPDSVLPCVPCHNRGVSNQVAEWLASPYSEARGGRGCTDCHDRYCSGNGEDPENAVDVATPGSRGPSDAVRLTVTATCSSLEVLVEVAISNVGVGHDLPTGPSERTLVLEVSVHDLRSVVVRSRLRPFATHVSRHRFELSEDDPGNVSARLVLVPVTGPRMEIVRTTADCTPDNDAP